MKLYAGQSSQIATQCLALSGSRAGKDQGHGNSPMATTPPLTHSLPLMQIPVRLEEIIQEKAIAEKDFRDAIGKLRYALNLQHSKCASSDASHQPLQEQVDPSSGQSKPGHGCIRSRPLHAIAGASCGTDNESCVQNCSQEGSAFAAVLEGVRLRPEVAAMHQKIQAATSCILAQAMEEAPQGAEECPVCNDFIANECMMGACGHRWCTRCHRRMRKVQVKLKCPLCNLEQRKVTTVSLRAPAVDEEDEMMKSAIKQLANSYGTKIDTVVQYIQKTLKEQPEDKVCVFVQTVTVVHVLVPQTVALSRCSRTSSISCGHWQSLLYTGHLQTACADSGVFCLGGGARHAGTLSAQQQCGVLLWQNQEQEIEGAIQLSRADGCSCDAAPTQACCNRLEYRGGPACVSDGAFHRPSCGSTGVLSWHTDATMLLQLLAYP
jgi:hypothetical protein